MGCLEMPVSLCTHEDMTWNVCLYVHMRVWLEICISVHTWGYDLRCVSLCAHMRVWLGDKSSCEPMRPNCSHPPEGFTQQDRSNLHFCQTKSRQDNTSLHRVWVLINSGLKCQQRQCPEKFKGPAGLTEPASVRWRRRMLSPHWLGVFWVQALSLTQVNV